MEQKPAILMYDLAAADGALRFSPFCWRTRFAIAHKQLALETIPWRFTDKEAIAKFGSERVPVIIDQGRAVHDSWRIAEYLEAAYPDRPSLFGGSVGRGLARFINKWADFTLHPLILRWKIDAIFAILHEKDRSYFRASREARFGKTLEQLAEEAPDAAKLFEQALVPLRRTLGEQQFLCGSEPYYADYILCGTFQWIEAVSPAGFSNTDDPLGRWYADVLHHYNNRLDQSA
jgi:glutathione S-transferase